jgi:hypothetical protein
MCNVEIIVVPVSNVICLDTYSNTTIQTCNTIIEISSKKYFV